MKASIQNLIQKLRAAVYRKDDLEFRDKSQVKELLPNRAYQNSNADVDIIL